jgi:hypothetical protein
MHAATNVTVSVTNIRPRMGAVTGSVLANATAGTLVTSLKQFTWTAYNASTLEWSTAETPCTPAGRVAFNVTSSKE